MDHGSQRILTALNQELLEQKKPGHVEELWYESSKDKRKIESWVVQPPDFDPSKKYPLILQIHGGPFADYGDRFDLEMQVYAAMGYVVLYTNPRGSTSYGEEFSNLIHHAYPGDDFDDLNSGVDALIAKGSSPNTGSPAILGTTPINTCSARSPISSPKSRRRPWS